MIEKNITKIIREFKSFEEGMINDIKNKINPKLMNYKECVLIKEDWYNKFSKIIALDKNNKYSEERDKKLQNFLAKKNPEIFNDIESAINCLNNLSKLKLISNNLIKLAYNDSNNLKNISRVHYYAGYNKLIVEYKENKENDGLLFINPLEDLSY